MMNGEETDGGISLGDMEKALVCLLMTSMEAPVQAESAGLTQEIPPEDGRGRSGAYDRRTGCRGGVLALSSLWR